MPHLSTRHLDPEVRKHIDSQLIRLLLRNGPKLLRQLLTETEQLMLAKRLATLLMLEEDFSYYRIASTLGISTSTIKRLHKGLLNGDLPAIEKIAHSKKEREVFWRTMESIFRAGLPPQGKGRWQGIDALLTKMK